MLPENPLVTQVSTWGPGIRHCNVLPHKAAVMPLGSAGPPAPYSESLLPGPFRLPSFVGNLGVTDRFQLGDNAI